MSEIFQKLAEQIGKPLIQSILALAFCGALIAKFLDGEATISSEVFTGFVGIIVGFYFGKQVAG